MENLVGKKVRGNIYGVNGFVGLVTDEIVKTGEKFGKFDFGDSVYYVVEFLELEGCEGKDFLSTREREQKLELWIGLKKEFSFAKGGLHSWGCTLSFVD